MNPAFLPAVMTGFFIALHKYLEAIGKQDSFWHILAGVMSVIFASLTFAIVLEWFIREGLPRIADYLDRRRYPEAAIAYAISGMTEAQLQVYASRYLIEPGRSVIKVDGIELDPEFVITTLQKAAAFYPEFPPTREGDSKPDELKKKALRKYLVMTGRLERRDGQRHEWINGADPANTLELLGYER